MDNQPQAPSTEGVSPSITSAPAQTPAQPPVQTSIQPPVQAATPETPKQKRKGLLITIICIIAVILTCGIAFAAFAIINNQPDRIAMEAVNNLINSKQIAVDGSLNISSNVTGAVGIKSFNIDFDAKSAESGQSSNATIKVNFVDGTEMSVIDFGEVMMKDGVFYLKVDGLKELYNDSFRGIISNFIQSSTQQNYRSTQVNQCLNSSASNDYLSCYNLYNSAGTSSAAVDNLTSQIMSKIDEIVDMVDNQWFKFSLEEMLDNDLLSSNINSVSRRGIIAAHDCSTDKINNFSRYSGEFTNLYNKYSFASLTPEQNSFYSVTLNPEKMANYFNAIPNTKFYSELVECLGSSIENTEIAIESDDIANALTYLPKISAKFDGFFNHHLTELKLTEESDYYTLSSDFKISYPNNIVVSAPTNATPVMDVVQSIVDKIKELSILLQ